MSKSRLQGILDRVSEKKFSESRWLLGAGVLTNYAQSFVDETMKRNAEFQTKAGVAPKIVRKSPTKCCPWCDALVGEYRYPDEVPADVYRRHDNCNCIVEYYPGDGRKQSVWDSPTKWQEAEPETLERRRTIGLEPKKAFGDYSDPMQELKEAIARGRRKIAYKKVSDLKEPLSDEEIIRRIGGGDTTKGSCSSVALSYIGEKCGWDVVDFRGGESTVFFARGNNVERIAKLPGAVGRTVYTKTPLKTTKELLYSLDDGKEYYMATGRHAAIVRRTGDGFEYLELQSNYASKAELEKSDLPDRIKNMFIEDGYYNGYHKLDDDSLAKRFGCREIDSFGTSVCIVIDADSLKGNEEFKELLGYLNTAKGKQSKGAGGGLK